MLILGAKEWFAQAQMKRWTQYCRETFLAKVSEAVCLTLTRALTAVVSRRS